MLSRARDRLLALHRRLIGLERDGETQLMNQGRLLERANAALPAAPISAHEFKVFSQWGEDGIIQILVHEVPILHRTFVEFGVEDFSESNCRFLMMKDNWAGLVIDGDRDNVARIEAASWYWKHDLVATAAFVTEESIDDLIAQRGFDADLGLLSVDIDGMDYWVLQAITAVRPRIVVAEYNSIFLGRSGRFLCRIKRISSGGRSLGRICIWGHRLAHLHIGGGRRAMRWWGFQAQA